MRGRFIEGKVLEEPKEPSVEALRLRMQKITERLYQELGHIISPENDRRIDRKRLEVLESRPEMRVEFSKFLPSMTLWVNTMYQDGLLTTEEAEFLLGELRVSGGRDTYATLCLQKLLMELDFFAKERESSNP